ncbi:sensor histidine kinase [Stappia stellulata]|uniref:sensor histidine kinase n=1 Tax=Stappia stellulata TaxID=71235 RepID=UPI0003FFE4FF|nr:sensor histidine kinase [Stappia stellulata]
MTSIRARLSLILLGLTGLLWLLAVGWIYLSTQAEVERVLDARLMEAARMVNSLLADRRVEVGEAGNLQTGQPDAGGPEPEGLEIGAVGAFEVGSGNYDRQLACQIWSLEGNLVGRSQSAPNERLSKTADGFSEAVVDGERWRVFSIENAELGVRVMVGDSLEVRDGLVDDVVAGLAIPALVILPVLALAILVSVRRGLSPLSDMAETLSARAASDLRPLPETALPREIAPAVTALNGLFRRVEAARERERSFTAFAAHELKTPLAGVKTQAQIALASADPAVHANALRQITAGVDRTSRLVRQLLDLAALEACEVQGVGNEENAADLLVAILAEAVPGAATRRVVLAPEPAEDRAQARDLRVQVEPYFLTLALRNLIENALDHAPADTPVTCRVVPMADGGACFVIEDEGPGIPDGELSRVVEKFVRGRNRSPTGSGLGLAIARAAMARMGGDLTLENRAGGGLRASLHVPPPGRETPSG